MEVRDAILSAEAMERDASARLWVKAAQLRVRIAREMREPSERSSAAFHLEKRQGITAKQRDRSQHRELLIQKQISGLIHAAIEWKENGSPEWSQIV